MVYFRSCVLFYILIKSLNAFALNGMSLFYSAALEAELQHAVINQPTNILQNCICYICKIPHLTRHLKKLLENQKELQDSERQLPQDAQEHGKLLRLRDKILPSLATVSGLRVYTSMLLGNYKQDHIGQMKQEYIEGLCRQFYTDIVMLIDSSNINTQKPADNVDGVVEEMMKHAALCNLYATLSDFEWKEKDQIREYIVGKQMNSPFIIVGGPCTGKTVLLATCAKQVTDFSFSLTTFTRMLLGMQCFNYEERLERQ